MKALEIFETEYFNIPQKPCMIRLKGYWLPAFILRRVRLGTGNESYCTEGEVYLVQLANKGSGEPEFQRYWLGAYQVQETEELQEGTYV